MNAMLSRTSSTGNSVHNIWPIESVLRPIHNYILVSEDQRQEMLSKLGRLIFEKKGSRSMASKAMAFNWQDPLNLDSCLRDEERMIRVRFIWQPHNTHACVNRLFTSTSWIM